MDNAWKDKLRERFSDYAVPEPEGLWEGIEQGMAGKARRKMLPVWLLSGAAAAAAVALVVFLPSKGIVDKPFMENPERYAEFVPSDSTVSVQVDTVRETASPVPFAVASRRTLLAVADTETETIDGIKESIEKENIPDFVNDKPFIREPDQDTEEVPADKPEQAQEDTETVPMNEEAVPAGTKDRESGARFSISLYREGGQQAADQSQGYGLVQTGDLLTRSTDGGDKESRGGLMRMLSANRASTYEARHKAPVRTGVTLAWRLAPHLSLTSGVNWTALDSEFEESTAGMRTLTRQDLGYLGVPLRLEAGFNPWKGLWLHAGGGAMVEKGLLATSTTYSYIGSDLETVDNRPDTGGLLWSAGVSAGAEYRFNRTIGLYLAPGLEYHFDNGSSVQSAYTEKPLHWNISLGIRFNFGK